jgi:peptidoglycan hydrolase CwlO-like protein
MGKSKQGGSGSIVIGASLNTPASKSDKGLKDTISDQKETIKTLIGDNDKLEKEKKALIKGKKELEKIVKGLQKDIKSKDKTIKNLEDQLA